MNFEAVDINIYIKKAIKNTVIEFSRKEKREMSFHAMDIEDALLSENDNGAFLSSENVLDELYFENEKLYNALSRLEQDEKRLLELTIIKGYADREIAKIISAKENTVTRRKNRALNKLKEFLGGV